MSAVQAQMIEVDGYLGCRMVDCYISESRYLVLLDMERAENCYYRNV